MKKTAVSSVDAYLAMQSDETRRILTRVRDTIRKALPGADESISYNIPTYKKHGRPVVYFAGWKRHYSLYPVTRLLVEALGDRLAPYEISKGTIRFPLDEPVPVRLIAAIAKQRAKEVDADD
jgi:uncharacterized protein YdhG (YjbR/CyaY superfamily)